MYVCMYVCMYVQGEARVGPGAHGFGRKMHGPGRDGFPSRHTRAGCTRVWAENARAGPGRVSLPTQTGRVQTGLGGKCTGRAGTGFPPDTDGPKVSEMEGNVFMRRMGGFDCIVCAIYRGRTGVGCPLTLQFFGLFLERSKVGCPLTPQFRL
jgi:hypothetical protein